MIPYPQQLIQNPVWKNCPPICAATMLPAFDTEKELKEFLDNKGTNPDRGASGATLDSVVKIFQCNACDKFHAITYPKGPGANSASGKDRVAIFQESIEALENKFKKFFKVNEVAHEIEKSQLNEWKGELELA